MSGAGGAGRAEAMWTLALEAVGAEVAQALEDAGVQTLVLKGPSLATWLYGDPGARLYVDVDLLVEPSRSEAAASTLAGLGFRRRFGPLPHPGMERPPASPWVRDGVTVDLHERIPGTGADAARAWAALREGAVPQRLAGRTVMVLGEPARLAHLALHAAHHGRGAESPLRDLERGLELFADSAWSRAASVASEIGAMDAFAAGLQLVAAGRALAARLGLEERPRPEHLLVREAPPMVEGLERLGSARGLRAKAGILRDELLPPAEFMWWWSPLARRSRRGLVAAYVWRPLYLGWHAPRAVLARRRLRRRVPVAKGRDLT